MTRRDALALLGAGVRGAVVQTRQPRSIGQRLPGELPPGVAAILERILALPPSSLNTDWFGTMPLVGALQWCRRGVKEVKPLVEAWLDHPLQTRQVAEYHGNRA